MRYAVVFEKKATGYSAYPPDLPGVGVAAETVGKRALIACGNPMLPGSGQGCGPAGGVSATVAQIVN